MDMLGKYSSDNLRYFMLRSGTFGAGTSFGFRSPCERISLADVSFSEEALIDRHDSELAANLGNLARRGLTLASKYCGGQSPDVVWPRPLFPF